MPARLPAYDWTGKIFVQVGVRGAGHMTLTVLPRALARIGEGKPGVDHAPVRIPVMPVQCMYVDQRGMHGPSARRNPLLFVLFVFVDDPDRPDVRNLEGVHVALRHAIRLDEGRTPGPFDPHGLDPVQEAAAPVAQVVIDDGPVVVLYRHFQEFFRVLWRQVLHVGGLLEVRCAAVSPTRSLMQLVARKTISEPERGFLIG